MIAYLIGSRNDFEKLKYVLSKLPEDFNTIQCNDFGTYHTYQYDSTYYMYNLYKHLFSNIIIQS